MSSRRLPPVLVIIAAILLSGCGENLDAECADLLEDLTDEFEQILAEESRDRRIEMLKNLPQEAEILSLERRAKERISEKISSGEIWSTLNPDAPKTPPKPKLVLDELNKRKVLALNGFIRRWIEMGTDTLGDAGWLRDEDSALNSISALQSMCNQTLR